MKSFMKHQSLMEEAKNRGEELEEFIVAAYNNEPEPKARFGVPSGAGLNLKKTLGGKLTGKAERTGGGSVSTTDLWSQYWAPQSVPASTKTPKTDIIIGGKRISLKAGPDAQLMSGGVNESTATFYAAVDRMGKDKLSGVYGEIENAILNLAPARVAAGQLKDVIKSGEDKLVNNADKAHKVLMNNMNKLFASDPQFGFEFCYEAMTGDIKFGNAGGAKGGTEWAAASHMLVCEFDGTKPSIHSVTDTSYVNKVVNNTKVSVRFKTSSEKRGGEKTGQYKYWSVIGLITSKLTEELSHEANMLTEGQELTENIITKVFRKVLDFAKGLWNKVVSYIRESAKNLMEFLGFIPEVNFNNRPFGK
jgi:hypothetical protein